MANDAQFAWVKSALGVETGGLTDADFSADAKRRKEADAEALKLGKQRREEMLATKDSKETEKEKDWTDKAIEKGKELMGDVADKIKIPRFEEEEAKPEDQSALVRFLADMESGTNKAKKYVDYIEKERARMEKVADITGLDRIGRAGDQLKKINGELKGGLKKVSGTVGKVGKAIKQAKKVVLLAEALGSFADASKAMRAEDRDSVAAWVKSLEHLWNTGAEFEDELKSQWWDAALAGSSYAVAAAPLIFAGSQLYIGINVLREGVKNVDAYFDRLEKIMKEIDSDGRPPAEVEPPPEYPGDWLTQEEEEEAEKRRQKANREYAQHSDKMRKSNDLIDRFNNEVFPKLYYENRSRLRREMLAAYRKDPSAKWSDWLAAFINTGGETYQDEVTGEDLIPTKEKVSLAEAKFEIVNNFRTYNSSGAVDYDCPVIKKFYDAEKKKFLAAESGKVDKASKNSPTSKPAQPAKKR